MSAFPCNACGLCCRLVRLSPETAYLDRGDGICRHFSEKDNLCSIYSERPLVCRVEEYYHAYLEHAYEWKTFVAMNVAICEDLKNQVQHVE